jgi:transcriptional regulator with XRE-family HTH domain
LARRAGLSVATVSRVEAGGVDLPTMAVIIKLAMACEGEVSELDIVRYSFARSVGVVLPLRAPMTSDFTWNWVRPSTEGATPVLV